MENMPQETQGQNQNPTNATPEPTATAAPQPPAEPAPQHFNKEDLFKPDNPGQKFPRPKMPGKKKLLIALLVLLLVGGGAYAYLKYSKQSAHNDDHSHSETVQ
jgi:uncharacterized protein HemX